MAQLADEPARALGVRIISPDRPGISGSSMQLDRKLSDWPSLVERLADDLGLGEFRMLAISGGAPYAYATAVAIAERVRAIAIVGGVIPFAELKDFKGLLPFYRWMLALYRIGRNCCGDCFVWHGRSYRSARLSGFVRCF